MKILTKPWAVDAAKLPVSADLKVAALQAQRRALDEMRRQHGSAYHYETIALPRDSNGSRGEIRAIPNNATSPQETAPAQIPPP